MDTSGGLVPRTYVLAQAPEFTLYGDGTVIFRAADDAKGDGFPPFIAAAMSAEQIDALLLDALDAGGLRDARESHDDGQATDMPTTVFTIDADDVDKSVAVHGLGTTTPDGPDAEASRGFELLGVRLVTFADLANTGAYQDAHPYQPAAYRAFLAPSDDPAIETMRWPWAELRLADFAPYAGLEDVRIGGLTPGQVALVTTEPSGGVPVLATSGPDGITYTLTIRPLLPGEPIDPAAPSAPPSPRG
jgi:hypothetical protein